MEDPLGPTAHTPTPTGPGAVRDTDPYVEFGAPAPTPPLAYAGFWNRFAAAVVDSVVGFLLLLILTFVLGLVLAAGTAAGEPDPETLGLLIQTVSNFVGLVGGWLYYALMESSRFQGTPGKMAIGIKVTDMAGNRIGFGRASGRYFGKILSALPLGLGYLMAAFTERKQGLHDLLAGCLVVRK